MVMVKKPSGFSLGDAESTHEKWPETFHIPSRTTRWTLQPGDMVKLIFIPPEGADYFGSERMWVEISTRSACGDTPIYHGNLRSHPTQTDIVWGDPVCFQPCHVCSIE